MGEASCFLDALVLEVLLDTLQLPVDNDIDGFDGFGGGDAIRRYDCWSFEVVWMVDDDSDATLA